MPLKGIYRVKKGRRMAVAKIAKWNSNLKTAKKDKKDKNVVPTSVKSEQGTERAEGGAEDRRHSETEMKLKHRQSKVNKKAVQKTKSGDEERGSNSKPSGGETREKKQKDATALSTVTKSPAITNTTTATITTTSEPSSLHMKTAKDLGITLEYRTTLPTKEQLKVKEILLEQQKEAKRLGNINPRVSSNAVVASATTNTSAQINPSKGIFDIFHDSSHKSNTPTSMRHPQSQSVSHKSNNIAANPTSSSTSPLLKSDKIVGKVNEEQQRIKDLPIKLHARIRSGASEGTVRFIEQQRKSKSS